MTYITGQTLVLLHEALILLVDLQHLADTVGSSFRLWFGGLHGLWRRWLGWLIRRLQSFGSECAWCVCGHETNSDFSFFLFLEKQKQDEQENEEQRNTNTKQERKA